ncbi:hypothetical protein GH741_18195 [Aquibacillus halophilus]|uniref:YesK-like protein n=1 Tax=Aquibacillus halophilus TaxID=930132 RepID=A0A6A8DH77_9BACI|nr:YesK family protein [Aquibacillus halophilus]MRH44580.1 hypothetical protein [Aquibacillus halophilus]
MDISIIVGISIISLVLAFLVHFLQKKTGLKRKTFYIIFISLLSIAIVLLISSYIVGGWTGLGLGALSIYIGVPSITTLLVLKIMEKS